MTEVYCPFTSDGVCIAAPYENGEPACPTPRERQCIGDDDE